VGFNTDKLRVSSNEQDIFNVSSGGAVLLNVPQPFFDPKLHPAV